MPKQINTSASELEMSVSILQQKINILEEALEVLKEDQKTLESRIKPCKDNSKNCINKDGTSKLINNWDIGNGIILSTDQIRARDSAGLKLYDDGDKGIFIKDGGNVGIGTYTPSELLHVYKNSVSPARIFLENPDQGVNSGQASFSMDSGGYNWIHYVKYSHGDAYNMWSTTLGDKVLSMYSDGNVIVPNGNIGIVTTSPTASLDVNSDILRLRTAKTPASAGAAGNQGDWCWDADFFYVCVATNTWKRAVIASW